MNNAGICEVQKRNAIEIGERNDESTESATAPEAD
jgi:hypothetical protein